jgi:threonine dehydrogenase-like Zn-dependent dehydrogenase
VLALTVEPGVAGSGRVDEVAPPAAAEGAVLVQGISVGICGTDALIADGGWGTAPPGTERLILGHESLGRVLETPPNVGLSVGDLVAGVVRLPGHPPCAACAGGEWDMCQDGNHVERGITGSHGFAAEQWRIHPGYAVRIPDGLERVGMLVEPASVVAKAWAHVDVIASRAAATSARRVLVTGAGTIGLLVGLLARQRGLPVDVFDTVSAGPKPGLVDALGGHYFTDGLALACKDADIVFECTGSAGVVAQLLEYARPNATICLIGIPGDALAPHLDPVGLANKLVRDNVVVFGTVNANRHHWTIGSEALAAADPAFLAGLITRRVPLTEWHQALPRRVEDVKVVIDL